METAGFKMYLKPGALEEFLRRYEAYWPELREQLWAAGVTDYTIYLDEETNTLFGSMLHMKHHKMTELRANEVVVAWRKHMSGLLKTDADGWPVIESLPTIFRLQKESDV